MIDKTIWPVPISQSPSQEYLAHKKSWFYIWPLKDQNYLFRYLIASRLIILPVPILVNSQGLVFKNQLLKLLMTSSIAGCLFTLILIIRQLLDWMYIQKRLLLESIEYEESGWHDGRLWEKSFKILTKPRLIAQYEVKPLILLLNKYLAITTSIFIGGYCLFQVL